MRILLIGGSGIISSEIVQQLVCESQDVYMINRGRRTKLINEKARLIVADVRNDSVQQLREKIGSEKFDVVIDFITFTKNQLEKTLSFTEGLYQQFVFISSATVYQKTSEVISENSPIKNDEWSYAKDKIECEVFLKKYFESRSASYTIIRPYITYGKTRFPYAMLPSEHWSLIHRLKNNKPVIMWNDGNAVCTLTHSREFAKGVIGLLGNKKAENETFHITSAFTYTWNEVINITAAAIGVTPNIVYIPQQFIAENLPQYAPEVIGDKGRNMVFDDSKIIDAVPDFKCQIDFKTGIKETVQFYADNPDLQVVNYRWDADMDWLIDTYYKSREEQNPYRSQLCFNSNPLSHRKDKVKYYVYRYTLLRNIIRRLKA